MKLVAAALVVLATSACAEDLRAPVNVAWQLYYGCMEAAITSTRLEPTAVGIDEFVHDADEQCLIWTIVWYKPLMGDSIGNWTNDKMTRFNQRRVGVTQSLKADLRKYLKVR